MGILHQFSRVVTSIATGHAITLSEMFRKPVTVRYPEEKAPPVLGARDVPVLKVNEASGLLNWVMSRQVV